MRFFSALTLLTALLSASSSLSTIINRNNVDHLLNPPTPSAIAVSQDLIERASKPKAFKKRPRPKHHGPRKHPTDCKNTNLIKNGEFNRNVKGWQFYRGSATQFFWIKDSKTRPSHSGVGQAVVFLNRGYSEAMLITTIPAVDYGNTVTVSAWMRYEEPSDISLDLCTLSLSDNSNAFIDLDLTSKWTKYSFETGGTGRPIEIQFRLYCRGTELPTYLYIDDVTANACLPKKPDLECQVIVGADNRLVNPGFECAGGIGVWAASSYYGYGNDTIAQYSGTKANPTHSGKGMAGLLLDGSNLPYPPTGVALFQYNVDDDLTRQTMKASFWLSADAKLNNMEGCIAQIFTYTGYYMTDFDISGLTTKWKKFELKNIRPANLDTFQLGIYGCTASPQPLIYLDDVYFGVDKSSPAASPTTTPPPEPTATAGPCTTTPELIDPSFEAGDTGEWLFFDESPNYDTSFFTDPNSTYGAPHAGSNVGVISSPTSGTNQLAMQQVFGLCNNEVYTVTMWFYIPIGYDASSCSFNIAIFAAGDSVKPVAAGVWTKVTNTFLASVDSTSIYPYIYVRAGCPALNEMVVLMDDITFGPGPPCNTIANLTDSSFESGNLNLWFLGSSQGDEVISITNTIVHSGSKSVMLTFPSTSNGAAFGREFPACVGGKYTFHIWHYTPGAHKGIVCSVWAYAWYTGEFVRDEFAVYDRWVETRLDFVSGSADGHVDFGVSCLNQLRKVVTYIDDVTVSTRT